MRFFGSIWFFLNIGAVLLLAALAATIYVWNLLQQMSSPQIVDETSAAIEASEFSTTTFPDSSSEAEAPATDTVPTVSSEDLPESTESAVTEPVIAPEPESETIIEIDTSQITDEQKAAAEQFGIDVDAIEITEEMHECAVLALGEERLIELQDGDAPSLFEGLSLLGCFKNN